MSRRGWKGHIGVQTHKMFDQIIKSKEKKIILKGIFIVLGLLNTFCTRIFKGI